ncbi:hypothetical protein [Tannockella kyphosi]|uniref:hypothetical protein n=1 Tax=Tannockella kyphosi TaxID=2899121 RepID=UPI002013131D|nr:hypothetical protein [Tannockella kyphosi]
MYEFFRITYTICLPIVLSYIVWYLKNQGRARDANFSGITLLLETEMIRYYERYAPVGTIPIYAYEHFMELYATYCQLGGHGIVDKMKTEIEQLQLNTNKALNDKQKF